MKGPAALQRPLVSLPVAARPVTDAEIARLDALRFWASVDRAAEARRAEKRALLAVAQDTAQALREGESR